MPVDVEHIGANPGQLLSRLSDHFFSEQSLSIVYHSSHSCNQLELGANQVVVLTELRYNILQPFQMVTAVVARAETPFSMQRCIVPQRQNLVLSQFASITSYWLRPSEVCHPAVVAPVNIATPSQRLILRSTSLPSLGVSVTLEFRFRPSPDVRVHFLAVAWRLYSRVDCCYLDVVFRYWRIGCLTGFVDLMS